MNNPAHIDGNVRRLLGQNTTNRNKTNREFILAYWQTFDGLKNTINRKVMKSITDPESISRSRRKAVEKNPSLAPTDKTFVNHKTQKEREMRKHYLNS